MSAGGGGGSGGGRPAATANWLILGGCGFLGRNFVKYLLDNGLAASVRVADKRHPLMCALSADHKAALLNRDLVELLQVDLAEDEGIDRAFAPPRGGGGWDFVVNLAAETAHGKPAEFYERGVACAGKAAAAAVAAAAAGAPVKRFIQVSSAFVYKPESSGSAEGAGEGARVEPWTEPARACARAEDAARTAAGLPLVVLRPATVYGPGDVAGLMPRCVVAATYKADGAKMEMLWDGTLKVSTVHVFDVVRAIYFAAKKAPVGSVFNLADKGSTDQARLGAALSTAIGVEVGFISWAKSLAIRVAGLDRVAGAANENHLGSWMRLLKAHKIEATPLTPYLHPVLLSDNHLCVNGGAIEAIGFKYSVPELTPAALREAVELAVAQGIFPPVL